MKFARSSGLLLHPISLPSDHGIGDLGSEAYRFVDFLAAAEQNLWQICPLGPTGYGDSPYQLLSAFAGNPYLISLDKLQQRGLLATVDLEQEGEFAKDRIEYGKIIEFKIPLLKQAFYEFKKSATGQQKQKWATFCHQHKGWLEDYALFKAVKSYFNGQPWSDWDPEIKFRQPEALAKYRAELQEEIEFRKFLQYIFFEQWTALKEYANQKGIQIIGDLPLFVALDSADVWANPEFFCLTEKKEPTKVAGVPPDYFSEEGQLWGNPLYDWDKLQEDNYSWWVARLKTKLELMDIMRLDHFKGFVNYWAVPSEADTARQGHWESGPREDFFQTVEEELGELPFISEDLGKIGLETKQLRDSLGLPGMKILQFAFHGGEDHDYLPHNYSKKAVVYTGTHDNNTTAGWYHEEASKEEKKMLHKYTTDFVTDSDYEQPTWQLLQLAWASPAQVAIAPLQDILSLGSYARLNTPGAATGNWQWRYQADQLTSNLATALQDLTCRYNR
ncbi:4-alpha-glucanotransferase [Halanaerobaculum tunisiense]